MKGRNMDPHMGGVRHWRPLDPRMFMALNTLSKVQKILQNATMSENTFQSFNMEVYETFFLV